MELKQKIADLATKYAGTINKIDSLKQEAKDLKRVISKLQRALKNQEDILKEVE